MDTFRRLKDIPLRTQDPFYRTHVSWDSLTYHMKRYYEYGLNLDPDFQRGHVWTEEQRERYLEYELSRGVGSNVIRLNHPGWMNDWVGDFVIVDGKQRLEAVFRFLRNETRAYGKLPE